ncbi:Pimeloyl-ACP methyl ester carboxylesterase [Ferrithrix thermotolerans DSM 19514]|uniref:Pimeloyl-ACP methyl ester carboxylesterase n=1 Tax=Ferrithrix thermotolerans DSM 19514 TaxID=1121881 RepID=A0A1M4T317_9ACTN|nr:Pimeloyl-ACP methyl ester carboxylesterase [Ferrithrix thermotolerans DSM 19514]
MGTVISSRLPGVLSRRTQSRLSVEIFHADSERELQFLLVHGAMDRKSSMRRLALKLAPSRVITYDRRGYDESLALHPLQDISELSPEEQVADIWGLCEGRPTIVFGHSMGGTLALHYASQIPPDLKGLVTYESPLPSEDWWPIWIAKESELEAAIDPKQAADRAERFMISVLGEKRWRRLPREFQQRRRAEGVTLVAEMAYLASKDYQIPYENIEVPLFSLVGQDASERHQAAQIHLCEYVRDTRCAQVIGAGHGAHIANPTAIAEILQATREVVGYK